MRKQLICSIQKDIREYIRLKKNLLFSFTILLLCAMVFCATKFLPSLISSLTENASHIISDSENLGVTIARFFPNSLKANMGILASDIAIFYGIVVILTTYNLIVKEVSDGKWIFPLGVGYSPFVLIVSKGFVYGIGAALPSLVFYNLYFLLGSTFLLADYPISTALTNSLVLALAMFLIVFLTILLASIYKQAILAAATMILFVVVAPDIFALFSFGKYLPTYMLTYLYQSNDNFPSLIIPIVITFAVTVVLTYFAAKKIFQY